MTWLSAFGEPPNQPLGTMVPIALPVPAAFRNACPWSGPDAAMKIFGVQGSTPNSCMKATTVGTSTEPSTTMPGFLSATALAAAASAPGLLGPEQGQPFVDLAW